MTTNVTSHRPSPLGRLRRAPAGADDRPLRDRVRPGPGRLRHHLSRPRRQLDREVAIKEYLPTALAVRQDGVDRAAAHDQGGRGFHLGPPAVRRRGPHARHPAARAGDRAGVRFPRSQRHRLYHHGAGARRDAREPAEARRPARPAEVDHILWPLLEGLEQVHNAGFLHRDIKPANILLDADGNPTLIDFGASRAAMVGRTTAMTAIFTPGYAAAEQMTSAKQGPWTDIYGLSATLYHAITGGPAQLVRPHARGRLRAAGQIAAGGFRAGAADRHRCRPRGARHRPAAIDRRLAPDPEPGAALDRRGDRGAWPPRRARRRRRRGRRRPRRRPEGQAGSVDRLARPSIVRGRRLLRVDNKLSTPTVAADPGR